MSEDMKRVWSHEKCTMEFVMTMMEQMEFQLGGIDDERIDPIVADLHSLKLRLNTIYSHSLTLQIPPDRQEEFYKYL